MDSIAPTAPVPAGPHIVRATPDDAKTLAELVHELDWLLLRVDAPSLSILAFAGHAGSARTGCGCGGNGLHPTAKTTCHC